MRRLLYLFALSAMVMLMLAPAAVAQDAVCDDFNGDQAAAQAALPTNPQLDRDNDGIACEAFLEGEAEVDTKTEVVTKTEEKEEPKEQPKEKAEEKEKAKEEGKKEEKKEMPNTGGPGSASLLVLGAGALLVGGGLLLRKIK